MKRTALVLATLLLYGTALQVGAATRPAAAFTWSPATPVVSQTVQFTDTSIGTPKSWSWTFGDGAKSTLRNPSHAYASAGTFSVTLTARNAAGSSTTSRSLTVKPSGVSAAFHGSIVLGSPTATSIKVSVFSPDQAGLVYLTYGTVPGTNDYETSPAATLTAGKPLVLELGGLSTGTRYYYRLHFQAQGAADFSPTQEYTFHTGRPPGSAFTFTVQADPHLDQNSVLDLYRKTLSNVLADAPDFHVDLGDTFMCEKNCTPLTSTLQAPTEQATVDARYAYERANFGLVTHSAPLFLVNGNHDGELGWLLNGTAQNLAVWATKARQQYFMNPVPDGFYSGDTTDEPFVGKRASWYAWTWGDALFVVLDPYWYCGTRSSKDGWSLTLGQKQYQWLEQTLAASSATFKFVFVHNLVGGLDGQMRGGIEAAPYFEWGGRNADGTIAFSQKRPGWSLPIHQLLVQHGVTAVFHGHDHLYARQ
jgi:PKD repeat protein